VKSINVSSRVDETNVALLFCAFKKIENKKE